ncbi:Asp-tRNA(Asn)/Glu-tRNA(Gln) amidotransferase subunit GatA, partial [bacterium]|nr:Asp-tRNA(Asn)/Glu-tRNA(Gln) amidotransferase subunit GatA [bacterium]
TLLNEKASKIQKSLDKKDNVILDFYGHEVNEQVNKLINIGLSNIYSGVTFLLKDNVNYKGHITTSGSLVMKDFVSPYSATIVDKILANNGIILGKTNLDEFGHGGTGLYSAFGHVVNPFDSSKIVGGSSSGSVVAIKLGMSDIAIGTDTGDSIRHPASYLGVVGFKPTYGAVSRYGVTPYASSLDHVGLFTQTVTDCAIGFDMIKGFDEKDYTSIDLKTNCLENLPNLDIAKLKIAVLEDVVEDLDVQIKDK